MARGCEGKDFPLARAETSQGGTRLLSGRPSRALTEGLRDTAFDEPFVLHPVRDSTSQVTGAGHLVHVAAAACLEHVEEPLFFGLTCEHEALGASLLLSDAAQGFEPAHSRHHEVHDYDVGLEGAGLLDRLFIRGGLAYDVEIWLGAEQLAEPGTEHRMVVCKKDLARVGRGRRRPCIALFH